MNVFNRFRQRQPPTPLPYYIFPYVPLKRPDRPTLKVAHHPIVKWLYETVRCGDASFEEVGEKAGSKNFFGCLRRAHVPRFNAVDDVLQVLGYRLAVVDKEGRVIMYGDKKNG
jgi:hypothetical protein